jgi:integrase
MPKSHSIIPRRAKRRGRIFWRVKTPKDLLQSEKSQCRWFVSKDEAYKHAERLEQMRGTIAGALLRLPIEDQEAVLRAIVRVGGDAGRLHAALDGLDAKAASADAAAGISEAVELFISGKEADGVSAGQVRNYKATLGQFETFFKGGHAEVCAAVLNEFLRQLDVDPVTRNNKRTELLTWLRFCRDHGFRSDVPAMAIAMEPEKEIELFTPDELRSLLKTARSYVVEFRERKRQSELQRAAVLFIAVGAFAGLRAREVKALHWEQVDFKSGVIHVMRSRTKRTRNTFPRTAPILPALKSWLELVPQELRTGPLLPSNAERFVRGAVAPKSGVAWKHNALRHSFATYRAALTNEAQTATEIGDLVSTMKRNYKTSVGPDVAKEWFEVTAAPPVAAETPKATAP